MKKLFLFSGLLIWQTIAFSQKSLTIEGVKVNQKNLFFFLDKTTLKYFVKSDGPDSREQVGSERTFSLKSNFSNLYFKWMNPLRYQLTWKDEVLTDDRDQVVIDFIKTLAGQFGTPVTSLNSQKDDSKAAVARAGMPEAAVGAANIYIPANGFNNIALTSLYVDFFNARVSLSAADIAAINNLSHELEELDSKNVNNVKGKVDDIFQALLKIEDPGIVAATIRGYNDGDLHNLSVMFDRIEVLQTNIQKEIAGLQLSVPVLNTYSKVVISKFLEETAATLVKNRSLVAKITPVFGLLQNSIIAESADLKGYYLIRDVGFEDGKMLQTTLTITEFEYQPKEQSYSKKGEVATTTLTFKKYDFFAVSLSTGIFYGSTSLKGFGVTGNGDQFTVTQDDIDKSTPVTAAFLNFNMGIGSRYFSPLFQLGIDPTKKRPFLLAGGGFSIPAARIAFSAGPIWTWDQSLDKLSVGQTITSTTDLDKDIQYRFDMKPKGWYLGIQYNF